MNPKPAYFAAAWALLFALASFYWAAGGETGLDTLAVEIERDALARDGELIAMTWITGGLKVAGALFAVGLARAWWPRRPAFVLGVVAGVAIALYGSAGLVEKVLIKAGVTTAGESLGADRVDWYLALWDPLWLLGGVLFILAAIGMRPSDEPEMRKP